MSSPNVKFDTIPEGIRKPGQYFEFNTRAALRSLPAVANKILLIGQKLTVPSVWQASTVYALGDKIRPTVPNGHYYICTTAGTSGATEPTSWGAGHGSATTSGTAVFTEYATADAVFAALTVKQLFADSDAKESAGEGSMLHVMAKAALAANPYSQLYMIALADNGANFASGTFAVTGPATAAGYLRVWIGEHRIEITFSATQSAATIAAALMAAINTTANLPVIASISAGTVTVTARNSGVVSNQIVLATEYTLGVGVGCTATGMASGTTDPDIQNALDKVASEQYEIIACPYNDSTSLGKVVTHLNLVSGPLEQRPGVAIAALVDSIANGQTLADALNSGRVAVGIKKQSKSPAYYTAARLAAVLASKSNPASNYDSEPVTGDLPPDPVNRFSRTEEETLLLHGLTPLIVESERVVISRFVSSFQTDESFLDITSVRSLDYVRAACRAWIKTKFHQAQLTDRTPAKVKSELLACLLELETPGFQVVENVEANKGLIIVERDSDRTRVNARIPADLVNGLHVFAGVIDMIL
jgi:phage tail sheath gpL-like